MMYPAYHSAVSVTLDMYAELPEFKAKLEREGISDRDVRNVVRWITFVCTRDTGFLFQGMFEEWDEERLYREVQKRWPTKKL